MGHKTSPISGRIGINKSWLSFWMSDKKNYSKWLHQDIEARRVIEEAASHAGIDKIEIKRIASKISVDIYVGRPGVVIGRGGKGIDSLRKSLEKVFQAKEIELNIHEVANPYLSARIVAQNVAEALKKGINPTMIMTQQLEKIKAAGAKGAKIWISGFGPIKQARTLKKEMEGGSVPLTTLRADIDYAQLNVLTRVRLMGVKVWIYKGEKVE
uniref:Small ribosomal subunit protein uS3 n=1 Tax=candidate division CPR3 bacterium TaxID=2268181 RepID=A0A7C5UR92_UNCC3